MHHAKMIDFATTRVRLDTYLDRLRIGGAQGIEAKNRLAQLHWLCQQIAQAEQGARSIDWNQYYEVPQDTHPLLVELQTLAESFYYLAWRLISLLDRSDSPIEALRNLKSSCSGIRMVRNQLLEHPEGANSGVTLPSFAYGSALGPRLKIISQVETDDGRTTLEDNQPHLLDPGLWKNAIELKSAIDSRLEASGGA